MCRKFRCDQRFSPYPRPVALVQKPPEDSSSPAPLALPHSPSTTTLYSAPSSVALTPQPPLLQILMSAEQCQVSNSNFANFIISIRQISSFSHDETNKLNVTDFEHAMFLFRIYFYNISFVKFFLNIFLNEIFFSFYYNTIDYI